MPAALKVDRKAVEVLVAALGVREAARRMGINENTVLQWSKRGAWGVKDSVIKNVIRENRKVEIVPKMDVSPARVLTDTLQQMGKETRIGLAKAAKKGADHAATLDGKGILASARSIKEIAGVASIVHSWGESTASVHISCMGGEQPADATEIAVEVSRTELHDVEDDETEPMSIEDELDLY